MDELMLSNDLKNFIAAIESLTELDENLLNDEVMKFSLDNINQMISPQAKKQSVNQVIQNLEAQGSTREEAIAAAESLKQVMNDLIYKDHEYSGNKKILIDSVMNSVYEIFDAAIAKYHVYHIDLPLTIEDGAKVPTYAHDTDACADLYALENVELGAHTYGNKIRTGVKIQLPEGWLAMIFPRSSIGAKTPLRLSNSVGIIDAGYRGELGVLYDNTSDEAVTINQGDRIAQLMVMPSYRFMPVVVDSLEESDRGEGGFGSTGT